MRYKHINKTISHTKSPHRVSFPSLTSLNSYKSLNPLTINKLFSCEKLWQFKVCCCSIEHRLNIEREVDGQGQGRQRLSHSHIHTHLYIRARTDICYLVGNVINARVRTKDLKSINNYRLRKKICSKWLHSCETKDDKEYK